MSIVAAPRNGLIQLCSSEMSSVSALYISVCRFSALQMVILSRTVYSSATRIWMVMTTWSQSLSQLVGTCTVMTN
jgi:hypothetical protein